jgi:hypothetical protein
MPVIDRGDDYFQAGLYTGNGSTQTITGLRFQPDFVWIKGRSGATDHALYDAVRGVQNQLESNTTTAETAEATGLTAFTSDGFTVGSLAQVNTNAATYVYWAWKANGAGVSNTDGTITSTVSVSTTSGFSIVTWVATNAAATIGHGLGVAPSMIIVKDRSNVVNWTVYHALLGNTGGLVLNGTNAFSTNINWWNNTSPTSSVFSVGAFSNYLTGNHVAYCFAPVAGYSAFGSYTGNGSADGPFVFTGFRPAFVMYKRTDTTGDWAILDTSRDPYNVEQTRLFANLSNADTGGVTSLDGLSNGFKMRDSAGSANASGATYIYMAFSEVAFNYALGR